MKPRIPILVATFTLCACAPGADESTVYQVQGFESVSAKAGVTLILKQGPFSVEAQSHGGDLGSLEINVQGSELNISNQTGFIFGRTPTYIVTASAPKWTAIKATAGVDVRGENLELEDMKVDATAGVSIELSGTCRVLDANASAGATIKASELRCMGASAKATAGAKIEAYASEKAYGKASAGAVIDFFGNTPMVEREAEIGGVINVKDD